MKQNNKYRSKGLKAENQRSYVTEDESLLAEIFASESFNLKSEKKEKVAKKEEVSDMFYIIELEQMINDHKRKLNEKKNIKKAVIGEGR